MNETASEPSLSTRSVDPLLDAVEARVLGCLIEKELTTPEQFPLTANAVVVACNQKTAREPIMDLEPGAVGHALRTLEDKRLVRVIHGSRALRYDQRCDDVYAISPEQRVLIGLLLLRGAQTAGELLQRSDRMHRYSDIDQVRSILERLSTRSPALVRRLPRGGGQREDRYVHLLCGEPKPEVLAAAGAAHSSSMRRAETSLPTADLLERIEQLERALDALRERMDRIEPGG